MTPAALAQYRHLGADLTAQLAVPEVVATPEPVIQRRNASAAEHAIREATGATVDASARPEASGSIYSTPFDASADYETPVRDDPLAQAAIAELAAIRTEEAEQAAADVKARRNARDRARRERKYKARARRGETHHGPIPRGA